MLISPPGQVTPIPTRRCSLHSEDEIHDENDHDDEEKTADMENDLSNCLGNNLENLLADKPNELGPMTQSEIASMRKMIEAQRGMLNNAFEQNTQLCMQNAELMKANLEYCRESIRPDAMKKNSFDMTCPAWYCGRAKELDYFLDTLRSTFQSHMHLFLHGDPDKVKDAASCFST